MPHVFISYVREDEATVRQLRRELEKIGVDVWLDRTHIKPGERWRSAIRTAIRNGAYFIACFSTAYSARERTYMNDEVAEAIDELRRRPSHRSWFIPVLLSATDVPDRDIGGGETLRDLQFVDLATDWEGGIAAIQNVVATRDSQPASRAPSSGQNGPTLRWETLVAESELSPYETFVVDPTKPWWPEEDGGAVVYDGSTGTIGRYGKEFQSHEEAESYGQWLSATHNHRSFYPGAAHAINFERVRSPTPTNVPVLYAAVANLANSQTIVTSLEVHVHGVRPLKATGESAVLEPSITYDFVIVPRPGVYEKQLVPVLKIAGDDAIAFRIVLRPAGRVGGYAWLIHLRLLAASGEICDSPYFQLVM